MPLIGPERANQKLGCENQITPVHFCVFFFHHFTIYFDANLFDYLTRPFLIQFRKIQKFKIKKSKKFRREIL